jgi:hypothetical protein
MSTVIRKDEWLAELSRLSKSSDDGLTAREIGAALGLSTRGTYEKISGAITAGLMVCSGRRRRIRVDGVGGVVPVYKLLRKRGRK